MKGKIQVREEWLQLLPHPHQPTGGVRLLGGHHLGFHRPRSVCCQVHRQITYVCIILKSGSKSEIFWLFNQGCQMVYFQTKIPLYVQFRGPCHLVYFTASMVILCGHIFYGHLVCLFPFWYVVPRKFWQPCFHLVYNLSSSSPFLSIF
jgi:hypothetical protein